MRDDIKILDGRELRRLKKVAEKSSNMVSWYAHPYDGTIRGGWCRWFRCEEGVKDSPENIASVFDDTNFCAEALNNFLPMIKTIEKLQTLVYWQKNGYTNSDEYRQLYRECMFEDFGEVREA